MASISKYTLKRFPLYLEYIKRIDIKKRSYVSSKQIAMALGFGEVQVRKDLALLSCVGRPKVGYDIVELKNALTKALICKQNNDAVLVGVGKIGQALLGYLGFSEFGLNIEAGFDIDEKKVGTSIAGRPIYRLDELKDYVNKNNVKIVILTVPKEFAQKVVDMLRDTCVKGYWNFALVGLNVPDGVVVKTENIATSLLQLSMQISEKD